MRVPPSAIEIPPASGAPPRRLVVVLHGVGADAQDLAPLARALAVALPADALLVPDGHEPLDGSTRGRQWFSRVGIDDENRPARVGRAARDVSAWIDGELARRGLAPQALVLVGFSQGAILSMDLALRRRTPPAAVVAIAGRYAVEPAAVPKVPRAVPVLIVHGTADTVMAPALASEAAERLAVTGAVVDVQLLDGLAHGIDARVVAAIVAFLRR